MGKLIVDGNQVYEIDEECLKKKNQKQSENLNQNMNGENQRIKYDRKNRR